MLHEQFENSSEELFSIANSMTSITSRSNDPHTNRNDDGTNLANETLLNKFANYLTFKHIYKVVFMTMIVLNLMSCLFGFYYFKKCQIKLIPNYLISFSALSVVLMEIKLIFSDDKRSSKFDFYYQFTLMEISKMTIQEQNRLKDAIIPLKIQKKKLDRVKKVHKYLIFVITQILEATLAILFVYTLVSFPEKRPINCPENCYNFTKYHLAFLFTFILSFIIVSVLYLAAWFLFSFNK